MTRLTVEQIEQDARDMKNITLALPSGYTIVAHHAPAKIILAHDGSQYATWGYMKNEHGVYSFYWGHYIREEKAAHFDFMDRVNTWIDNNLYAQSA